MILMKVSKQIPAYRDGYVKFVRHKETAASSFAAFKNTRSAADYDVIVTLAYDRMNIRERDYEFAESLDKTLNLKIRCPYHADVNSKLQAVIGEMLYDVYQVDPDVNGMKMFVYMQENRRLGNDS